MGMLVLDPNPPEFVLMGRYMEDRKAGMDKVHQGDFLWLEEKKVIHGMIAKQNEAFAWDDLERGNFREDMFPPVEMPVIEHIPWALKNIPIPLGLYLEVCKVIKTKIDAGVYEGWKESTTSTLIGTFDDSPFGEREPHSERQGEPTTLLRTGASGC